MVMYRATALSNVIDKFPFSSDGDATDVGDLTAGRYKITGQSDVVNGFGYATAGQSNHGIDKFPFSADGNSTDIGEITQGRYDPAGPK